MSRTKTKPTIHGMQRALERTDLSKKQAEKLIKHASQYGKSCGMLEEGPVKKYVTCKADHSNKRIKYLNGYIFVFQNTSNGLITMYRIPDAVLAAQEVSQNKNS